MRTIPIVLAVVVLAAAGILAFMEVRGRERIRRNEREAFLAMKTLANAERIFRLDDLDDNGLVDYWTGDVAGLRVPQHLGGLFSAELAGADAGRPNARPYHGYLLLALAGDDPKRFAFCAYPAEYGRSGRTTFIVNQARTVHACDTGGRPIFRWPNVPWAEFAKLD